MKHMLAIVEPIHRVFCLFQGCSERLFVPGGNSERRFGMWMR